MSPASCSGGSGRTPVVVVVDDWVKRAQYEERMAFKCRSGYLIRNPEYIPN
jgi:hypothetical protein